MAANETNERMRTEAHWRAALADDQDGQRIIEKVMEWHRGEASVRPLVVESEVVELDNSTLHEFTFAWGEAEVDLTATTYHNTGKRTVSVHIPGFHVSKYRDVDAAVCALVDFAIDECDEFIDGVAPEAALIKRAIAWHQGPVRYRDASFNESLTEEHPLPKLEYDLALEAETYTRDTYWFEDAPNVAVSIYRSEGSGAGELRVNGMLVDSWPGAAAALAAATKAAAALNCVVADTSSPAPNLPPASDPAVRHFISEWADVVASVLERRSKPTS